MGSLGLLLLLGAAIAIPAFIGDSAAEVQPDDPLPDDPTPEPPTEDDPPSVVTDENGNITGTAGDDTITVTQAQDEASVNSGAGDDVILHDASNALNVTLNAGAGDDSIQSQLGGGLINAGEGDDTIEVGGNVFVVNGDAGNDSITGINGTLNGGDGNDTLQSGAEPRDLGTGDTPTELSGGAGDDLIIVTGQSDQGSGYTEVGNGGTGNDTIIMRSVPPSSEIGYALGGSITATGGAGNDSFTIDVQDATLGDLDAFAELLDGTSEDWNPNGHFFLRDGEAAFEAFEITDFERGVDALIVDADVATTDGVLASARIEESTDPSGAPLTELILTYESPSQPTMQIITSLHGVSGLTWDDVAFVSQQPAELVAVPA